jgi:hypothetical protein
MGFLRSLVTAARRDLVRNGNITQQLREDSVVHGTGKLCQKRTGHMSAYRSPGAPTEHRPQGNEPWGI